MNIFANSVIASVKTEKDLMVALETNVTDIFMLKANINTVSRWIELCHNAGKRAFIHTDLAEGIGRDDSAIQYLANVIKPDGVLSTKINVVKAAIDRGLFGVYRVFLIDQQSMDSAVTNIKKFDPTAIEIMPGIAREAIAELHQIADVPIIGGGFVKSVEILNEALEAGAVACSTSSKTLWRTVE